jgi:hypothetical protein
MGFHTFNAVVGLTTATLAASSMMTVGVNAAVFEAKSGVTSVFLDFENVLEPVLGISLVGADGTVDPAPGPFQVGFTITPDTNFSFSDEGGFTPLGGTIEHTGSVTLGVEGLADPVTVGDFTIGYDAARATDKTTGFFVKDNLDLDAILFDVAAPVATFEFADPDLTLGSDLAVSPEFAAVLASLGKPDVTGAIAGAAQVNAIVQEQPPTSVPEPLGILGLLLTGAWLTGRRQLSHR